MKKAKILLVGDIPYWRNPLAEAEHTVEASGNIQQALSGLKQASGDGFDAVIVEVLTGKDIDKNIYADVKAVAAKVVVFCSGKFRYTPDYLASLGFPRETEVFIIGNSPKPLVEAIQRI